MTTGPLRAFLQRVCQPGTIERLIDPILSDIALEYRDALRRGDRWRARWLLLLGYVGLFKAMTLHGVGALTRKLKPDEADVRTIAASLTAFVVLTFALVLPPLTASPRMHRTSIGLSPDRRGFQALTAGGPATARSHQRRLST